MSACARISIGIDIGGTFIDVVASDDEGTVRIAKLPSTPSNPGAGVASALARLLPEWSIDPSSIVRFTHGTTVATNAVLERKGALTGLLVTEGFEDVLEIGRQNRTGVYDLILRPETPAFLAPGARRKGVTERVEADGTVTTPLDLQSLRRAVESLVSDGVETIAVCFLFAFQNPLHERQAAAYIREAYPHLSVSVSSEVDPAFREYERTVVTAFDAYVKPVLQRYLGEMRRTLDALGIRAPLQVMQSRGGLASAGVASHRPIRLFLSGPAAGVVGAREISHSVGEPNVLTVDIGGTSTDISIVMDGSLRVRADGLLDGYRIRVPMVDVNAIGAGGGSVAWLDDAGALRVGPRSAGSDPGPACYGRGGAEATVTDACVALGWIDPDGFPGGTLKLDPVRARAVIEERIAVPLGLGVEQAAHGIIRIAQVNMAEGIRLVSVRRGIDPRTFALVAFGGGGPLHATALAEEIGIRRIVVPRAPGVLCAAGLLAAPTEHEVGASFIRTLADTKREDLAEICQALEERCAALMRQEPLGERASIETIYCADVCYVGQAHYIEVQFNLQEGDALPSRIYERFCLLHDQLLGHSTRSPARFVGVRVIQRSAPPPRAPVKARVASPRLEPVARLASLRSGDELRSTPVLRRENVREPLQGPAILEQDDTTIVLNTGWIAHPREDGTLVLERTTESEARSRA